MRARGIAPDIGQARHWYEIARQMGAAEAARHLEFRPPE
jgi:TPR repeat protein